MSFFCSIQIGEVSEGFLTDPPGRSGSRRSDRPVRPGPSRRPAIITTTQFLMNRQILQSNLNEKLGLLGEECLHLEALAEDGVQLLGDVVLLVVDLRVPEGEEQVRVRLRKTLNDSLTNFKTTPLLRVLLVRIMSSAEPRKFSGFG